MKIIAFAFLLAATTAASAADTERDAAMAQLAAATTAI
jgi:hypothetical protein